MRHFLLALGLSVLALSLVGCLKGRSSDTKPGTPAAPPAEVQAGEFNFENAFGVSNLEPKGVIVGDLNGSGYPDAVVVDSQGNMRFFLNSNGSLVITRMANPFPAGTGGGEGAVVDVDQDGDADILQYSPMRILKQRDDSFFFDDATTTSMGQSTEGMVTALVADFAAGNGPDFMELHKGPSMGTQGTSPDPQNRYFVNSGSGTYSDFTGLVMPTSTLYSRVGAVGDFNGDGSLDAIVANGGTGDTPPFIHAQDMELLISNTKIGRFDFGTSPATTYGKWIETGDVDGDGDTDFVMGHKYSIRTDPNDPNGWLTVSDTDAFINDGSANFTKRSIIPHGTYPTAPSPEFATFARMGDLDLDGDLDIAIAGRYLYGNDGNGNFTLDDGTGMVWNLPAGVAALTKFELVDMDTDGDLDVVGIGYNTGNSTWELIVLKNEKP